MSIVRGNTRAFMRHFVTEFQTLFDSVENYSGGDVITLLKEGFSYKVADTDAEDYHLTTKNGTRLYCVRPEGGFSLAQWGVKPGDASWTETAQAAIDRLLDSGESFVRIPAGHFIFSQLRLFNSSGSSRAQRGKFKIVGAGNMSHSDIYNGESVGDFYGTLIEIQGGDPAESGIVLASGDGKQRRGQIEDLTIIYGGTGYAIDARYIPFLEMRNVSVRITNEDGKAINIEDSWGGVLDRCIMRPDKSIVSKAHGVRFGSTLFAGNWKMRDCVVDYFDVNIWFDGGANFANVIIENSWFQKFRRHGILCEAPLWNLVLRDEYMETSGSLFDDPAGAASDAYIKIDSSGKVANFEIDGGFFLGGTTSEAWVTEPLIDLTNVKQAKFSRIKYLRPYAPLVNLNSDCILKIDGIDVTHDGADNLPVGPLFMITAMSGFHPKIELNRATISDTSKLAWVDENEIATSQNDCVGMHPRGGFSRGLVPVTIGLGSNFTWSTSVVRPLAIKVNASAGAAGTVPVAVKLLPASGETAGSEYIVFNGADSTQDVLLRNGQNSTNMASVRPGECAKCYADPASNQWMILISTIQVG